MLSVLWGVGEFTSCQPYRAILGLVVLADIEAFLAVQKQ